MIIENKSKPNSLEEDKIMTMMAIFFTLEYIG